ncbi:MAG: protein kinase [Gemmataceae bacterium]|nr:protein kinase [Gemmataceae bacterium]
MTPLPERFKTGTEDGTRVQSDLPPQTLEFAVDSTNPSFGTLPPGGVPDYPFLSPPQAADEIGRLGEYRILKKLGEGGMGFVFRGEDPALKRFIALKVMRPEVAAKPMATDRFLREGRAAAGLKSDHIITIYQVGQANGVPFLAMEFLEGLPLDEWFKLQKKAIPLPHVLRVVRDTLRGLAIAHDKGLIHRDIKPANLWLEKGTSRIKLLDFGLTRGNEADMQLTQEGAVVGTPAFMAPEQASGKPVDPRADLFSVGVVMYTLLAGKNPFARGSLMETLGAVGFETQAPVTTVRPDVPKEYSDFLDRLLAKTPDARPANAKAALSELVAIEKALQEGNRTLAPSGQSVVVVPLSAPAPQVWDELTDLDDSPPARPTRTKDGGPPKPPTNKKLLYGGGLFAFLAVFGGIIIIITNKDGTQTKVEVPDGAKVEVKDKGKTVATVGGKKEPPKRVVMDADRKAAEMIRLRGGAVRIGEIWVAHNENLPEGPFKLNDASIVSGDTGLTDSDLDLIVPLTELKNLTLSGPITDAGLAKIAASTWAPQLASLSLRFSRITDDGLKVLPKFIALNYLDLGKSAGITGTGLRHLKDLQIQSLNLNGVPIKAEEYIHLAGFPQLQALDVINSGLTDNGIKNIVAAVPRLQQLQIQINAPLTDAGIKHLEKHPTLEMLNIGGLESGVGLTPASLESLRTIPNLRAMEYVWFGTGGWTDADLKRMAGFDKLESLSADFKLVTDEGLKTLTQLKSLKTLNMKGSKVTTDGVAAFRKARPDVTLTSDFDVDPERRAAEFVISRGGSLDITGHGTVAEAAKLPVESFVISQIVTVHSPSD